ncbi:MAG: SU10 major capsid protein [Aeromonas popoffii]|uniref:SU10 major capsid protein n=1 Tax=Aeromonas popoffii TaxID=70856 RepID=UPI003F31AA25
MTMLKTFDLRGNKLSFAEWISNLSPCETPFISMIGKEKVDQTQYSWQTDALAKAAAPADTVKEGSLVTFAKPKATEVHTNFTQILRKAVRVSDTTKKVSLYGRSTELGYQLEKAGMEIKRDLESMILNSKAAPRPGTAANHGIAGGVQHLVATVGAADADTGAVVNKVVQYTDANAVKFTQVQVFDMTYNLYLVGSKANKVMVHPMHMHIFSDWIGANAVTPHVHRMFDGMDEKYNAHVSTFRDPLGQVFEIIPNRYMPKNQLFFFNESDWTQMILREPAQIELAKNGSSEKHMIEMEVGLRHRNPFASGILEFNETNKPFIQDMFVEGPANAKANDTDTVTIKAFVEGAAGGAGTDAVTFTGSAEDGTALVFAGSPATPVSGVATATTKSAKVGRAKIKGSIANASAAMGESNTTAEFFETRD